jgi:DNA recombination protein RmuC
MTPIFLSFLSSLILSSSIFFYFLAREKQKNSEYLGEIKGQLKKSENEIIFLREEKGRQEEKFEEKINYLSKELHFFEKESELLKQSKAGLEKEKAEFSQDKVAILSKLSEELLRKNQEQQSKISKEQQENIEKFSENLFKNFETVSNKLSSLDEEVKKSAHEISTTKSALLSPGGAGKTSEITLENILKNSNLLEKETFSSHGDYILQSHFSSNFSENSKRPDAILFLPNNQIIIIDSKSSSHFIDLEKAKTEKNQEKTKEILSKIKESFRRHLEDLKRKDYSEFLFEKLNNKKISDYKIFTVMFLQTEQMLEIVKDSDANFEQKAFESNIVIATPIVLIHLLSNAKFIIDRIKQDKNIEILKTEIGKLLDNLVKIVKESEDLGKSIKKTSQTFNKLTRNLNRSVNIGQKINELGIEGKKSDEIRTIEEIDED